MGVHKSGQDRLVFGINSSMGIILPHNLCSKPHCGDGIALDGHCAVRDDASTPALHGNDKATVNDEINCHRFLLIQKIVCAYLIVKPASRTIWVPVIKEAPGEARNSTAGAISIGTAILPSG